MITILRFVSHLLIFFSLDAISADLPDLFADILNPESVYQDIGARIAASISARQVDDGLEKESAPTLADLRPKLALMFHAVYDFGRNCPGILESLLETGAFENIHVQGKTGGNCTKDQREEIDQRLCGFRFGDDTQKKSWAFQRLAAEIKPKSTGLFFELATEDICQPFVPRHYGSAIATFKDRVLTRACHSHMDTASGGEFVKLKGFHSRYDRNETPFEVMVFGPLTLADVDEFYFECEHWEKKIPAQVKEMHAATGIQVRCYTFGQKEADDYFSRKPAGDNHGVRWDATWAEAINHAPIVVRKDIKKRNAWNAKFQENYEQWRRDLIAIAKAELSLSEEPSPEAVGTPLSSMPAEPKVGEE